MVKATQPVRLIIQASMAVAAVSFFLPWVQLLPPGTKKIPVKPAKKEKPLDPAFKGRTKSAVSDFNRGIASIGISVHKSVQLSGFQIPKVANSEAAKAVFQLAELFQKKKSDFRDQLRQAGPRAYAVYLVPLVHLMFGIILLRQPGIRWLTGVVGFIAFIIPLIGFWQVAKALAQSNGLVATEYGLRLSLLAYLGLTYAAAQILRQSRPRNIPG